MLLKMVLLPSIAHWFEEDDFRKNGGVMNHETVETIE